MHQHHIKQGQRHRVIPTVSSQQHQHTMAGPQEKLQGAVTAAMDRLDRAYIRKLSVRRRLHVSSIASARLIG